MILRSFKGECATEPQAEAVCRQQLASVKQALQRKDLSGAEKALGVASDAWCFIRKDFRREDRCRGAKSARYRSFVGLAAKLCKVRGQTETLRHTRGLAEAGILRSLREQSSVCQQQYSKALKELYEGAYGSNALGLKSPAGDMPSLVQSLSNLLERAQAAGIPPEDLADAEYVLSKCTAILPLLENLAVLGRAARVGDLDLMRQAFVQGEGLLQASSSSTAAPCQAIAGYSDALNQARKLLIRIPGETGGMQSPAALEHGSDAAPDFGRPSAGISTNGGLDGGVAREELTESMRLQAEVSKLKTENAWLKAENAQLKSPRKPQGLRKALPEPTKRERCSSARSASGVGRGPSTRRSLASLSSSTASSAAIADGSRDIARDSVKNSSAPGTRRQSTLAAKTSVPSAVNTFTLSAVDNPLRQGPLDPKVSERDHQNEVEKEAGQHGVNTSAPSEVNTPTPSVVDTSVRQGPLEPKVSAPHDEDEVVEEAAPCGEIVFQRGISMCGDYYIVSVHDDADGSSITFSAFDLDASESFTLTYSYAELKAISRDQELSDPENQEDRFMWVINRLDMVRDSEDTPRLTLMSSEKSRRSIVESGEGLDDGEADVVLEKQLSGSKESGTGQSPDTALTALDPEEDETIEEQDQPEGEVVFQRGKKFGSEYYIVSVHDNASASTITFSAYDMDSDTMYCLPYTYAAFDGLLKDVAELKDCTDESSRFEWCLEHLNLDLASDGTDLRRLILMTP